MVDLETKRRREIRESARYVIRVFEDGNFDTDDLLRYCPKLAQHILDLTEDLASQDVDYDDDFVTEDEDGG